MLLPHRNRPRSRLSPWQITQSHLHHFPPRRVLRQRQVAVLGTPVRDAYLAADELDCADGHVVFRAGSAAFDVAHVGTQLRFGEKREAHQNLGELDLTRFTIRNGGGVYHTTTQMARLCQRHALPTRLHAIDLVAPWPELTAAYAELQIEHRALGLESGATNLILTNGQPDRLILKSPVADRRLTGAQKALLRQQLPDQLDLLVVNSLRSVDLARTVMRTAQQRGVGQYSVLTPSLTLDARIELQLRHDRASVSNLAEFALIADAFAVACPTDETHADLADVAAALVQVAARANCGALVVTLGSRGCLVKEASDPAVTHVALHERHRMQIQAQLQRNPARKNGVGDRFFGSFVLAHAFGGRSSDRAARAAQWASMEMVRQLAPGLRPTRRWIKLTTPTSRFWRPHRGWPHVQHQRLSTVPVCTSPARR